MINIVLISRYCYLSRVRKDIYIVNQRLLREITDSLQLLIVPATDLVSVEHAAALIGVTTNNLYVTINAGRLHYVAYQLLDRREVLAYQERKLKRRKQPMQSPTPTS